MKRIRTALLAGLTVTAIGGSATAAAALTLPVHPTFSGSAVTAVTVTSIDGENSPSAPVFVTSSSYVGVLGTTITVPLLQRQLVLARFNAQVLCSGVPNGWCEGQIVAVPSSGGPAVELSPQQPAGFVLASPPSYWASTELDRSAVLGGGTWTIEVQLRLANGASRAEFQGLNLEVERAAAS